MAVHSTHLGHVLSQGTAEATVYTVPANTRTILKSVVAQNLNAAAQRLTVKVWNGATQLSQYTLDLTATGTAGQSAVSLPWIVLNAGWHITVVASAASISVALSGTELSTA